MPNTATIQTRVLADPMTTWQAYIDPNAMRHWNFASDDWRCADAKVEPQVGGIYWARLEATDGSMGTCLSRTHRAFEIH